MIDLDDARRLRAAPRARHHELRPQQGPRPASCWRCSTPRSTAAPTSPSTPTRTCPARPRCRRCCPAGRRPAGRTRRCAGCAIRPRWPGSGRTWRSHGSDGCHGVVAEWDTIEISGVARPELGDAVGRTVAAARRRTRRANRSTCSSTCWSATTSAPGSCSTSGTRRTCSAIMRHPRHTGGSDGLLVGAKPHPRAWGTFPRYLGHYCRDLGLFSLEECVGHLTGRAAARLRLADRGLVRPGLRRRPGAVRPRHGRRHRHLRPTRASPPPASRTCSSTAISAIDDGRPHRRDAPAGRCAATRREHQMTR